ncbi:hypothetical protein STAN_5476 [Streptomyces sp. CBMAI 2042]|nr:hypothetical protein STAN_5476 [Streptomyces sp. CBMAI 2042]
MMPVAAILFTPATGIGLVGCVSGTSGVPQRPK